MAQRVPRVGNQGGVCCCSLPVNHTMLGPDQIDAMSSQREGQLDDEADNQLLTNPLGQARSTAGRGGPIASLGAGPQHRPTVDGMDQVANDTVAMLSAEAGPHPTIGAP